YQQVLRTVAFSSSSDNPTDFGADPSRTITWQVNDGTVDFQTHVDYAAGSQPSSVAIGDLNGDHLLDLAVANQSSNNVSVLLDSGGTFSPVLGSPFATGGPLPFSVAIGDLNGDGLLDIAVANLNSSNVSVLLSNGGTFSPALGSPFATGPAPRSVAIGDLN